MDKVASFLVESKQPPVVPEPANKLKDTLWREKPEDKKPEAMAQGIVGSTKPRSSRAAAALASMAKGDDKLTRKAEEQAAKVSTTLR